MNRTFQVDVTYADHYSTKRAGDVKANAVQVARQTAIHRYGGRRDLQLANVANRGRAQLQQYMTDNPQSIIAQMALRASLRASMRGSMRQSSMRRSSMRESAIIDTSTVGNERHVTFSE